MKSPATPGITLLGLGPGDPLALTRQAWETLQQAEEIYLRTRQHPVVSGFPGSLRVHSFDELYENGASFEGLYSRIVERILELGRRPQGVLYAVPGHPYIAEATGPEIARRARAEGLPLRVVDGMSFLEPIISLLEIDPFPQTALVDALELAAAHTPSFPPSAPAIIAQIHSRAVASEVKLTLMAVYPDDFEVQLMHAAGTPAARVERLKLYEIDRSPSIGLLTSLYLPALSPAGSLEAFQEVIAHLRAPDGCPWDREQTHASLRPYLLEEAYEVLTALDAEDPDAMREEFGDLLLQVVLHAQIAEENGDFNLADILQGIHVKIVRRHPHVFGDHTAKDAQAVLQNWEKLKAVERAEKGKGEASLLDGVALALPALVQAEEYQKRAARVGFDWPAIQGVMAKVEEEMQEVYSAPDAGERAKEVGDLLFAVVNLARWYHIDAESALREANTRFRKRFTFIEEAARRQAKAVNDFSLDEMEALWQSAKSR
jgi:tetrapyrrole methylase family protein/MazG family protein